MVQKFGTGEFFEAMRRVCGQKIDARSSEEKKKNKRKCGLAHLLNQPSHTPVFQPPLRPLMTLVCLFIQYTGKSLIASEKYAVWHTKKYPSHFPGEETALRDPKYLVAHFL